MEVSTSIIKPHDEAAAIVESKPILKKRAFDQLLPELRARAFTITGLESATVMQNVRDQIAALPRGQTWDASKREIVSALDPFLGEEGAKQRATLLLRTHGFQAFQASNWRVAREDDDTTHLQYLATEDDRVRDTHIALNGIVLPKDDPFWDEHFPPWEWNCRCRVRPMNPDLVDMEREADKDRPPGEKMVLEGAVRQKLRDGTLIRGTRTFDVLPPEGKDAYRFHPSNLTIPLEELKNRYDPEIWNEFRKNSQATEIGRDFTLWDYLEGRPIPPTKPSASSYFAALEDEQHLAKQKRIVAVATDAQGQPAGREVGFSPSLKLPSDMTDAMEGGTLTVNHPSGQPPTPQDIQFAINHNLKQLRIVVPEGTWIAAPGEAGWPDVSAINENLTPDQLVDELRGLGLDVRLVSHGEEFPLPSSEPPMDPSVIDPQTPPPAPSGPPVSSHVTFKSAPATEASVKRTLAAIDTVHGDGGLSPGKITNRAARGSQGTFRPMTNEISVKRNKPIHAEMTAAHEIGHWIDYSALPGPGSSAENHPDLSEWRSAVMESAAIKNIQTKAEFQIRPSAQEYLLRKREIWARAYAQFIAQKSADPILSRQVSDVVQGKTAYPVDTQWAEEDFSPIARAMENVFKKIKWL